MTLTTSLADDAAIFELSYTRGNAGVYHLAGAWGSYFPFSTEYANGAAVIYRATDGSANTEIGTAIYNAGANSLTRSSIIASSNGGTAVNWTGRTRLLVHALKRRLQLCATPPTIGQVLAWNGSEWCPETLPSSIALCPTPPTDGQVLIWDAMTNEWCPADFCALVAACMTFSVGAVDVSGLQGFGLYNFPAMTDSPRGIISVWLKGSNIFVSQDNAWLIRAPSTFGYIDQHTYGTNTFFFSFWDSPVNNSQYSWASAAATPMSTTAWVNVLMSWNMNAGGSQLFQLYFGDTAIAAEPTWPQTFGPMPFSIAYSSPSDSNGWTWGLMNAEMSEAYFAPGQYLDFSNSANRAKFHDLGTGKPVSLGLNGSLPTGVPPTLYLHISRAETNADNFANNDSGAGSLTIDAGTLSIAPTSPSD